MNKIGVLEIDTMKLLLAGCRKRSRDDSLILQECALGTVRARDIRRGAVGLRMLPKKLDNFYDNKVTS